VEGDVRLIPVAATGVTTAACDQAHFGGVEVFAGGRWARVCNGGQNDGNVYHAVVAQVCKQAVASICSRLSHSCCIRTPACPTHSAPAMQGTSLAGQDDISELTECYGSLYRCTDVAVGSEKRPVPREMFIIDGSHGQDLRRASSALH